MERTPRRCKGAAVLFLLLLVSFAPAAKGQNAASVRGTITDPSAAAIQNATIRLINTATGQERTTQSSAQGNYVFLQVLPGTYRLVVDAAGFENYEQQVQVQAGASTTVNVVMKLGQVQQQVTVQSQSGENCLVAEARVLPGLSRGLRAIRRGSNGNYYVLTAPGAAVMIYNSQGTKIGQAPSTPSAKASITYGEGLDVDSSGRIYVADRGSNAIKIYDPDGAFAGIIPVLAPVSVKALSGGQVAVASMMSPRLVGLYDSRGRELDSFGELPASEQDQETEQPKTFANRGWFYGDSTENLFFNLTYMPDPTIRKYDRYGYAAFDISISSSDYAPGSISKLGIGFRPDLRLPGLGRYADQAISNLTTSLDSSALDLAGTDPTNSTDKTGLLGVMGGAMGGGGMPMMRMHGMGGFGGEPGGEMHDRMPGMGGRPGGFHHPDMIGPGGSIQFSKRPNAPQEKVAIDSFAVEPGTDDVWVAIAGDLIHYDKTGNRLATYCINTVDQEPIKPTAIVIEDDDILLGTDPFGVFEYVRPDKIASAPTPANTTAPATSAGPAAPASPAVPTGSTPAPPRP